MFSRAWSFRGVLVFPSLLDTTILIARIPFLPGLPKLFSPETGQGSGHGQAQSEGDPQHQGTCTNRNPPAALTRTPFTVAGVVAVAERALPDSPRPHPTRGAGGPTSGRYAEILLPHGLSSGPPSPSRGLTLSFSEHPSCPQGLSCPAHSDVSVRALWGYK